MPALVLRVPDFHPVMRIPNGRPKGLHRSDSQPEGVADLRVGLTEGPTATSRTSGAPIETAEPIVRPLFTALAIVQPFVQRIGFGGRPGFFGDRVRCMSHPRIQPVSQTSGDVR